MLISIQLFYNYYGLFYSIYLYVNLPFYVYNYLYNYEDVYFIQIVLITPVMYTISLYADIFYCVLYFNLFCFTDTNSFCKLSKTSYKDVCLYQQN